MALCASVITPAHAADPSEHTAGLVAEASPEEVVANVPVPMGDGTLVDLSGGFVTEMPATAAGSVVVEELTEDGTSVDIGLPIDSGEAAVTEDGSVVYYDPASDVSLAVQSNEASVRFSTVLESAAAPTRFAYPIQGAEAVLNGSGGVDLYEEVTVVDEDGTEITERVVTMSADAPWATDAAGRELPTRYEIEGNTVYQVVETDEHTQFPVVADPNWWKIGKCVAAVTYVAFTAAFLVGKSVAIVKAVKAGVKFVREVGGVREAAKLIVGATTAAERTRFFNRARAIAGASVLDFLGITMIRNNCF